MTQDQIQIKTPEFVSLQFRLAGLGSRAAAMIIDQILLTIVNMGLIFGLVFMMESNLLMVGDSAGWFAAIWLLALFAINFGYFLVSEYFFNGKTIGKNIIGIRVIQENGHSITILSAIIRNLLRVIDMLPASYFLGMLLVFLNSKHKRLGDMAAGTIVIHEGKAKRQKKSPLVKEIERRQLDMDSIHLDEWTMNSFGKKEYDLLKTYSYKLLEMPEDRQSQLTREMAAILFPKIGLSIGTRSERELENILLILYLKMKDEWEFDL